MGTKRFPIEAGHVLMFARSLGDTNSVYSDAAFDGSGFAGIATPPTFVQASAQFDADYPLRPHPGQRWFGSGQGSTGEEDQSASGGGILHAEQRFDFARPIRVGDVLTSRQRDGKTWEKTGRRGGRMIFSELITEYFDAKGELVVTATSVAVQSEAIPSERDQTK